MKVIKERVPSSQDGQKWGMGMRYQDKYPLPSDTVSIEMVNTVTREVTRFKV